MFPQIRYLGAAGMNEHRAGKPVKIRKVLVCSPSWIGDMIMSLPALQVACAGRSNDRFTIMTKPPLIPLWELSGVADEIIVQESGLRGTVRTSAVLRSHRFDAACIIPNSFRSALIPWLAAISRRIGFRGHWRSFMINEMVAKDESSHRETHQCYEVAVLLGLSSVGEELPPPKLKIEESAVVAVLKKFSLTGGAVALIPGAARGSSKCWPVEHYADVGEMLAADDRKILLFGSNAERKMCEVVAEKIGDSAVNLAGKTDIKEWAILMKTCAAVVANDSGGMHLAAAVDIPGVALFGITDPGKTGPLGGRIKVLQNSDVRSRKIARDSVLAQKCLESISPKSVYEMLQEVMDD